MQAVNDNKDFDLHWGGNVFKTVKARELWNKLIHYAWKRAEPGLLFWDMICKSVPAHNYDGFKCVTTNPCLTGGMRLLTINGHKTIRELWAEGDFQEYDGEPTIQKHGELKIINSKGIVSATNVYRTSECANIFRVTLKNGIEIDATENHKFILNDGSRKTLAELEIGDELSINQQQVFGNYHYPEYAELAGWVIGDGSLSRNKTGYVCAHITCWNKDIENVLPILREDMLIVYKKSNKSTNQNPEYEGIEKTPKGFNHTEKEICSRLLGRLMEEDGVVPGNKHHVPKSIWNSDKETIAAFLRGFFSADGSVQVNENKKCISIRNCQVNKSILTECQFLLNQFGITSSIFRRREATKKLMNDGKGGMKLYNKKAEHEIIISGRNNCGRFISEIGFIQKWKSLIGLTWIDNHAGSNNSEIKFTSQIKSIEFIGREETYCLTEPENHEITINNIHIAQCGEVSLSDGDSCNLGSMNLGKYVINPFKKAEFDYTSFENDTRLGVRFLDNIISLEKAPLPFQQRANDNGRRLGLGVMGFADMLLKSGIRYDSDQAIALADRVGLSFMRASYSASCDLAEEKGSFPIFDPEIHAKSEYIKRLPDDIKKRINKTGIRNIAVHAIAPTGSLSCIAQCSSAIEPVFMMRHIRKTNLGTAKKVEEHEIFHPVAKAYIEQTGENQLPDYFVSSHQISPDYRIKLQALMNKYIDQSISNTVNLPADTPEEKIAYYYMEAWRQGCKGITVYRDGSREGVLVSAEQKPTPAEITIHSAPKRPLELDANIHVIKPNGKTYTIFIGVLKDRPYEVFALDHKQAGLADGMKGKIIKVNREKPDGDNVYNFESGALLVRQLNRYEGSDVSLITRLISTSLRHGTPLEFLVDQTFKSKDPLASFGRAIARALSLYIKKEDIEGKFKCPKCGGRSIKYEGMCFTCLDCAHSKCS
jgi:ribonucleoside-diphosphate reductase alpha chain